MCRSLALNMLYWYVLHALRMKLCDRHKCLPRSVLRHLSGAQIERLVKLPVPEGGGGGRMSWHALIRQQVGCNVSPSFATSRVNV